MKFKNGIKAAFVLVCAVLVLAGSMILYEHGHARLVRQRTACTDNLKRIGRVFRMYAEKDPEGFYPALDATPGRLSPQWDALYPQFLSEPGIMTCPANEFAPQLPDSSTPRDIALVLDDHSYWYFGYVLPNEIVFHRFVNVYTQETAAGRTLVTDLNDGQGSLIMHLRQDVASYFVPDAAAIGDFESRIPILMERPDNHSGGGHVLYMDGHIEFIPYPGKYPMTANVVAAMQKLNALSPVKGPVAPVPTSAVPEGILETARLAKTGFVFHKLDLVMSVVSEDFTNPEYVTKRGLRNHLQTMQKDGDLDQVQVFFQYATWTRNNDGTWTGSPLELKARFGTATFTATLRQEDNVWRVISLDVKVGRATNL